MIKPSTPQVRVLLAAIRNGGSVPAGAFAYAGYFRPVRGCEHIVGVLHRAAKATTQGTCEKTLLDGLDTGQLLMAGGFLGVERDGFRDGRGTIAERYATAIRTKAGRIEGTSVAGIRACIHNDWLTERWEITEAGREAARLHDPEGYAQALPADEVDAELERVVAGVPVVTRALVAAAASVIADRVAAGTTPDAPVELLLVVDEAHAPAGPYGVADYRQPLTDFERRAGVLAPDPAAVAGAMAGYDPGELTPAEQAAANRGISPVAFRRLYPAVTGDLMDELLPRIEVLRAELGMRLVDAGREDLARTITGDPREAGYRVALTDARRLVDAGEPVRKAAFHLELALTAIENGHGGIAGGCLVKASAALAK